MRETSRINNIQIIIVAIFMIQVPAFKVSKLKGRMSMFINGFTILNRTNNILDDTNNPAI